MRRLSLLLALFVPACGWFDKDDAGGGQHSDRYTPSAVRPHAAAGGAPEAAAAPAGLAAPVTLAEGQFKGPDGKVQPIHGFSYFGFNTPGRGGFDGLPWGQDPIANDFLRTVHRQKLLGFNAVRIPFSFAELQKEPPSFEYNCTDVSDEDLVRATLPPTAKDADIAKAPKMSFAKRTPGKCNTLASTTVRERLYEAVEVYVKNGFYVLLDNHLREDTTAITDQRAWTDGWKQIAADLLQKPENQGRLFFDLLNEPGQYGQGWEKTDKAGIHALYIAAMDSVWQASDKAIFFIEGTGQETLGANWGDGFCADPAKITQMGLGDPRPFFSELATKPYKNSVAVAPHCYGPAVTYAHDNFAGPGLFSRLSDSFGCLNKTGTGSGSPSLRLPVAVGEFGSHFKDNGDVQFMTDFAAYLGCQGAAKDDRHDPIDAWFYWSWNPDSGDTGGLVQDNWKDVEWVKISYLEGIGLTPWYSPKAPPPIQPVANPTTTLPRQTPAGAAPDAPSASTATPAAAAPSAPPAGQGSASAPSTAGSSGQAGPSPAGAPAAPPAPTSPSELPPAGPGGLGLPPINVPPAGAPQASPTPSRPSTPPATKGPVSMPSTPPADGHIHARVHLDSSWDGGGGEKYHAYQIHLINMGDKRIDVPYSIHIEGPKFTQLQQPWNIDEAKCENGAITGQVAAAWAQLEPHGKSEVVLGLVAKAQDAGGEIHSIKVAGAETSIEAAPQ